MSLRSLVTETAVARSGMTVGALFAECVRTGIPGLPYVDECGTIVGKASIRNVLKVNCMPDYLVRHSHLLGDSMEHVRFPEIRCHDIMAMAIDDFVLEDFARVGVSAPVSKLLARMEQHDTTYIFVLDGDREYVGAVSIVSLASHLMQRSVTL